MKKALFNILFSFTLLAFSTSLCNAKTMEAQVESHRIPDGTMLKLRTYNAVSTDKSYVDDQFDAMLIEDKIIGKEIVLPQGTLFRGRVTDIIPNKMLSKSAVLFLNFDNVVTPTGKQLPTTCAICGISMNSQGGITDNGNYGTAIKKNLETAIKITKNATNWGLNAGEDLWGGAPKYVLTPISAIAGVTCSSIYFVTDAIVDIFKKGSEIYMNQDTDLTIMLVKPLDIPVN